MAAKRYSFDGEWVTAAELARRITCYSEPWLGAALKAGCRSVRDLTVRYQAGERRGKAGSQRGKRSMQRRSFDIRHLKPRT